MALDAKGYFHHLKSYLNLEFYAVPTPNENEVVLVERIRIPNKKKPKDLKVKLTFDGEIVAIKLDKLNKKGNHDPLFHFLENVGKPWSKRCDFVIFQLNKRQIKAYCFEFKYQSVDSESVVGQLKSSENWCRALNSTINIYTGLKRKIKLTKYLITDCAQEKANIYLDRSNTYLDRDPSIKHYFYSEIDGMRLDDLEHVTEETIG